MSERRWTAADFDYSLPEELIAQTPAPERGASRMLVVERERTESCRDASFVDLAGIIPAGDLLVVNTTRVRHARLLGTRPSGGPAEVLLVHPGADDTWIAMGTPGSAMQPGKQIKLGDNVAVETLQVLDDGMRRIRFIGASAADAITRYGRIPLPPYIAREPTAR